MQLRQQYEYQVDNMQISTHAMSRDEVRDRTQAAIQKLSNYILVTTLILGLAAACSDNLSICLVLFFIQCSFGYL